MVWRKFRYLTRQFKRQLGISPYRPVVPMLLDLSRHRFLCYIEQTMSIVYFWPIQFWGEAQIPVTVTQEVVSFMGAGHWDFSTILPVAHRFMMVYAGLVLISTPHLSAFDFTVTIHITL